MQWNHLTILSLWENLPKIDNTLQEIATFLPVNLSGYIFEQSLVHPLPFSRQSCNWIDQVLSFQVEEEHLILIVAFLIQSLVPPALD